MLLFHSKLQYVESRPCNRLNAANVLHLIPYCKIMNRLALVMNSEDFETDAVLLLNIHFEIFVTLNL